MKKIKVSVLIYVLNDAIHIEKCMKSVMSQTLRELEILVIDGGSMDGTLEKAETLSNVDDRIRILHSKPSVGLQFNLGLKEAHGTYIGICESDDYICEDMYEKQYEIAEKYRLDILKANVNRFCETENHEYIFPFSLSSDRNLYGKILNPQEDMEFSKLGVNGFWSGLYRRDFLLGHGIFMNETKGASYQDISFSFMAAVKSKRVYIMKESFYFYRMDNPDSSINNPNKITILIDEYRLLKQRLRKEGIFERYREVYLAWKVSGHLWFFDNLSMRLKQEYIQLMYLDLRQEFDETDYQGTLLTSKQREAVRCLDVSIEKFHNYMCGIGSITERMKQNLSQIDDNIPVLIFGYGNLGKLIGQYLFWKGKAVAAYVDNDCMVWNSIGKGLSVIPPEKAVQEFKTAVYVVSNAEHYREMCEQLSSLGVKNENILVINNYDMFLKHILIEGLKEGSNDDQYSCTGI